MSGLLKFLAKTIPLFAVSVYFLRQYQDADLTVHFYEKFGLQPCVALKDKVVWITGASSGIGEYLAYELCKCGCKIVLSARRESELQRVKEKCAALDIEQELLDLNTVGTMSMTKAVLPVMLEANSGQIVVVSSVSGKYGWPYQAAYCASKFAIHGYFDTLRMELSDSNINIQLLCPGPVHSNVAANAFTSIKDKSFKDLLSYTDSGVRMPTERCAYLMAVSMANKLDEVWISTNPMLAYTYMCQYMPTVFQRYSKDNFLSITKKKFFSH
ncbi:dehydrogenase/reductase SDR family member 7-like [Exaiptasia diaphana]|uniref:Dehydrogenase/reductase SDR family member 7 n=1 Tax=Exaiptasia diaphana TaxID=2652724 RepID=A0A913WVT9_EXADI|nr:dehydrogenase/reductase SDR family member 7-like [Exaiptasia diaphana]